MAHSFINTSGNIITEDFCNQLLTETKAEYVKNKSFGEDVKKIDEDIATTFELLRERWEEIRTKVLEDQFDTTQLRDRWIKPFLSMLGFDPQYNAHNLKNNAAIEYHIPYRGWNSAEAPLIHMVHSSADFDTRDKNSRTHPGKSPHDLLQQYLNTSPHSWAILINGKRVRILRDFYHSITKGFIEFDLEGIFESASTEQFRILYRMMHASRFAGQFKTKDKPAGDEEETPKSSCLLEEFHVKSRETGVKVGENLRKQVRIAIETLGNGFAENLNPDEFDEAKVKKFYSETLNIIYRLLFLLFAEQKGWLPVKNSIYARTYSVDSLRQRAEKADYEHDNNEDLWEGLKVTFRLVTKGYTFPNGDNINAFGGQLFSDERIFHIKSPLKNKHLLKAIDALCFFEDKKEKNLKTKINYATLAIDELGSVYESLLDYEPRLLKEAAEIDNKPCKRGAFVLDSRSTERKTTGSYYTDSRLVAQLIDSALVPVIENAINAKSSVAEKRAALLELKVADIACGSGAFLIAALEKMGEYLSLIGKEEGEKPTEQELRHAKREVLQNCIYGVDLNPMAVELAKFSLWITASMPNFPLSFLDHKLKCGNSLIGATPELIDKGIPEEAFNPVTLDDNSVCADLKKRVKKELEGLSRKDKGLQTGLEFKVTAMIDTEEEARQYLHILHSYQQDAAEVENVAHEYMEIYRSLRSNDQWRLADAWTAAFFILKNDANKIYPTNITLQNIKLGKPVDSNLENEILELARKYRFFHWHLEFPEVFESGGFDCVIGNPPWEKVTILEREFFTDFKDIVEEKRSNIRKKRIENLSVTHPAIYSSWIDANSSVDRQKNFYSKSERYMYSAVGELNLYPLFVENNTHLNNKKGRSGLIIKSGMLQSPTWAGFTQYLLENHKIVSAFDYRNWNGWFPAIGYHERFTLITLAAFSEKMKFGFYLDAPEETIGSDKVFDMSVAECLKMNPLTKNIATFSNRIDKDILSDIYSKHNILGFSKHWNYRYSTGLHMSLEADELRTFEELNSSGLDLINNFFYEDDSIANYPLLEGKLIHQYDHRFATFAGIPKEKRFGIKAATINPGDEDKKDADFEILPRYWVSEEYHDNDKEKEGFQTIGL